MTGSDLKSRVPRNDVLNTLGSTFAVFQECRPLAIGIHKIILERVPAIDPQRLRLAMKMHTASTRYLKAITHSEKRFDLDGNPVGEITAEQKQQALDTLRERFRKGAELRKAQLLAQQQEQQRQEKLLKLAEKFNKR
jgi:ProP effector